MVLFTVDLLFELSVASYLIIYVPGLFVLTLLVVIKLISLSQLSITLALSSLYLSPVVIYTVSLPFNIILGASLSVALISMFSIALFPLESSTSIFNLLLSYLVIILLVIFPSALSSASIFPDIIFPFGHTFKLSLSIIILGCSLSSTLIICFNFIVLFLYL